jgi:hypothetical protein
MPEIIDQRNFTAGSVDSPGPILARSDVLEVSDQDRLTLPVRGMDTLERTNTSRSMGASLSVRWGLGIDLPDASAPGLQPQDELYT